MLKLVKSVKNPAITRWKALVACRREREKSGTILVNGLYSVVNELPGGLNLYSLGLVLHPSNFQRFKDLDRSCLEEALSRLPSFKRAKQDGRPITIASDCEIMGLPTELAAHVLGLKSAPASFTPLHLPHGSRPLEVCDILIETDIPSSFFQHKIRRLLVCPKIKDPGNLGSMLRLSGALPGWDGLFCLDKNSTDITNPKVIRASKGALFSTAFQQADFESLIYLIKKNNMLLAYTDSRKPENFTRSFTNRNLEFYVHGDPERPVTNFSELQGRPIALFMGSESGELDSTKRKINDLLSKEYLLDNPEVTVRIPLQRRVDSINVASAAAIVMHSLTVI